MNQEHFSATTNFIILSNCICLTSCSFGFLSIFIILRYTNRQMLGYRLHLLNMAVTILICDFCIAFLLRPHGMFPATGLCMIGPLNPFLTQQLGNQASFYITVELLIYVMAVNVGAFTNASIHRYISITKILHTNPQIFESALLSPLMFFIQFIWPAIGVLFCTKIEFRSENALKANEEFPELVRAAWNQSCLLLTNDFIVMVHDLAYLFPIILHGVPCVYASLFILGHCWWKLRVFQNKQAISSRTLNMQRKLMYSLGIQTFVPNSMIIGSLCAYGLGLWVRIPFFDVISGSLTFHIGSMHSIVNCVLMCITIPAYKIGIQNDIRLYFFKKKPQQRILTVTNAQSNNLN